MFTRYQLRTCSQFLSEANPWGLFSPIVQFHPGLRPGSCLQVKTELGWHRHARSGVTVAEAAALLQLVFLAVLFHKQH